MNLRRSAVLIASLTALALPLAACGGANNPIATSTAPAPGTSGGSGGGAVVVGSADFSESVLLAEIYAGALKAKGVNVSTKARIGSRETYLRGMTDGSINLIPEYTGALAYFYDKKFAETDPQKVYDGLAKLLPADLVVLKPSAAEDNDSITVSKATADKYKLASIADLAAVAKDLVLGAPPEFKTRPQGIPGLTSTYGVTFKDVKELKGQALVQALKNGQVDAANVFTTDPSIPANSFVVLKDDKHLFGTQNVVPLIAKKVATQQVTDTLDAVSAKLTTQDLSALVGKVDVDHQDASAVAKEWLTKNGLA